MAITVRLAETQFRPGDTLTGEVAWETAMPLGEIPVTLYWYTAGKGQEDVEVVARSTVSARQSSGRGGFRFDLPDFPWSFSGSLVSLVWAVEAGSGHDEVERVRFVLAPDGEEVRL
jgi:hypothetical protein